MNFEVTVLGSSAMYATQDRACAGYLLRFVDSTVLLDCGGGVWKNLLQHTDAAAIDGVILSHRHPDHVTDLFQLLHARLYGGGERPPEIPLWAPAETLEKLTAFSKELDQGFHLTSVSPGDRISIDGAAFSFFHMAHPPDTVGVRVESDDAVFA